MGHSGVQKEIVWLGLERNWDVGVCTHECVQAGGGGWIGEASGVQMGERVPLGQLHLVCKIRLSKGHTGSSPPCPTQPPLQAKP